MLPRERQYVIHDISIIAEIPKNIHGIFWKSNFHAHKNYLVATTKNILRYMINL